LSSAGRLVPPRAAKVARASMSTRSVEASAAVTPARSRTRESSTRETTGVPALTKSPASTCVDSTMPAKGASMLASASLRRAVSRATRARVAWFSA
jgi:hypothetical protein